MRLRSFASAALSLLIAAPAFAQSASPLDVFIDKSRPGIKLELISRIETGIFDDSAAEIAGYDRESFRLFVTNSAENSVMIFDLTDQSNPTQVGTINLDAFGGGINSVAASNGLVAAAVEADPVTDPGQVVFFDIDGQLLGSAQAGALPDMVTFTTDGTRVITANEGEPDDGGCRRW